MKRLPIFLILTLIGVNSVFAVKWTNNVGVGATVSVISIGADQDELATEKLNQLGYGVGGTYIGVHESGFTAKVDVSFGLATSKDVTIQERKKTNLGAFENISFGMGYSFANNDKFLFGLAAMGGVELGQYSVEPNDTTYNGVTYDKLTTTLSLVTFSAGGDIFAAYRISERFGIFANLTARYIIVGDAIFEHTYEKSSRSNKENKILSEESDLGGNFIVEPTIGVIWRF